MPQCPICYGRIEEEGRPCPHCATLYHPTCFPDACVVAGCQPRPAPATPERPATRRRPSIVEVCLVAAIMAVLVGIAVPNFRAARERCGPRSCYANQKNILGAMEMYNLDKNTRRTHLDRAFLEAMKSGGYLQSIPDHPGSGIDTSHHYHESHTDNGITCDICGSIQ